MKRSTNEQRNYRDAMIILLDLYYLLKETEELSLSEPVIRRLAMLFHKTIPNFSPCTYFPGMKTFSYRAHGDSITLSEHIAWNPANKMDFEGLYRLLTIMDAFRDDLKDGIHDLFLIKHAVYERNFQRNMSGIGRLWFNKEDPAVTNIIRNHNWMNINLQSKFQHNVEYIKGDPKLRIQEGFLKTEELNEPPSYYELFHATCNANTNFSELWGARRGIDADFTVRSPQNAAYFLDVIKYILVKYVTLFGSFKRIKVCKKCGKLFYEKKYGSGIYCTDPCRINDHAAAEPKAVRRCRARQNRWLERRVETPHTVIKSDCLKCKNQPGVKRKPPGGECIILLTQKKNDLGKVGKKYKRIKH